MYSSVVVENNMLAFLHYIYIVSKNISLEFLQNLQKNNVMYLKGVTKL